jgi:hypothetical protein
MREPYPHGTNDPHATRHRVTIDEVVDPVMLPVAYGIAVVAVLWLIRHVARGYRSAPKRVPLNIRADGRPGWPAPKPLLWLAPGVVAAVVIALGLAIFTGAQKTDEHAVLTLVMLAVAEVTWFVGWAGDRQIEMARKMTYRVAPGRLLRAVLPIIVTVVVLVFVGARH